MGYLGPGRKLAAMGGAGLAVIRLQKTRFKARRRYSAIETALRRERSAEADGHSVDRLVHYFNHLDFAQPFNVAGAGADILGGDEGDLAFLFIEGLAVPLKEDNDALAYGGIE